MGEANSFEHVDLKPVIKIEQDPPEPEEQFEIKQEPKFYLDIKIEPADDEFDPLPVKQESVEELYIKEIKCEPYEDLKSEPLDAVDEQAAPDCAEWPQDVRRERYVTREEEWFECAYCQHKRDTKAEVKAHVWIKHATKNGTQCAYKTKMKYYFDEEIMFEKLKWFECEYCPYQAAQKRCMKLHMSRHHGLERQTEFINCEHCPYRTMKKSQLKRHVLAAHTSVGSFKWYRCPYCFFKSTSQRILRRHIGRNHVEPGGLECYFSGVELKCAQCPYRTRLQLHLDKHVKLSHPAEEPKFFQCSQCPYRTKYKSALYIHQTYNHQTDGEVTWYACAYCSYKRKIKYLVMNHMRLAHSELRKHKCPQCPFETKYKLALDKHKLKKHAAPEEVQWFQCPHCPYKGKSKQYMKDHRAIMHALVEKVKFLKCDECSYVTKSKRYLTQHVRNKHTALEGVRWFKCAQCTYKSKFKSNLKVHLKKKHGIEVVLDKDMVVTVS